MTTTEIATFVGIVAVIIISQLGRHPFTLRRLVLPLVVAGGVGYHYLQTVPSGGGTIDFAVVLSLAGAAFGVIAALLIGVERDGQTGRVMLQAGLAYAALWIAVFGGRLAFAWAATHVWTTQIRQFSIDHALTSAAWTDAFVLMAVAMVLTRTIVVAARILAASRPAPVATAA
jgi:hypothetical protein